MVTTTALEGSVVDPDLTFQVNPRIQGFKFNDQNLKKKIHLKFFLSFLDQKCNLLIPGLLKRTSNLQGSLQLSKNKIY